MKRPQTTTDGEAAQSSVLTDDLESTRRAYKRAKKAYKDDKSNKELKEKKTEAKIALEEAEAAAEATSPSETKAPSDQESKVEGSIEVESNCKEAEGSIEVKSKSKEEGSIEVADGTVDASPDIKLLDEAYQKALSTFKANKTDKDLRRAKTAARRALDNAILAASSDGKQLLCVNCSKKFIFSTREQQKYEEMGWKELPKRCEPCKDAKRAGEAMMDRSKLDGKKKNMCYSFQRGECPHGNNCKFSHNPNHGGKRSNAAAVEESSEVTDDVLEVKEKESKERKERGLLKKGTGWRNK